MDDEGDGVRKDKFEKVLCRRESYGPSSLSVREQQFLWLVDCSRVDSSSTLHIKCARQSVSCRVNDGCFHLFDF